MDTIDNNVMQGAAEAVIHANQTAVIHTVTVTLNGQHGGADVKMHGFKHQTAQAVVPVYDEFTETVVIR